MKNGEEQEETKNFSFTIRHGYPVHNLNHIIHRKLFELQELTHLTADAFCYNQYIQLLKT